MSEVLVMVRGIIMWAHVLVCVTICATSTAAQPAVAALGGPVEGPIVVATYRYGTRDRGSAIRPMAAYLASTLARPYRVVVYGSPTELVEALNRAEVHVAVPNLTGFIDSRASVGQSCAIAVPDVPEADADRYRSVWLARRDAALSSFASLAANTHRLRVVMPSVDSASGAVVPLRAVQAARGNARGTLSWLSVSYSGSHESTLGALQSDDADVAALAASIWDAEADSGLIELWRSEPVPPGPILCAMHAAPCRAIADALFRAHQTAPEVQSALNGGWPEYGEAIRLKAPAWGDYAGFIDAAATDAQKCTVSHDEGAY